MFACIIFISVEDNHFLLGSHEYLIEGCSDLETEVWVVLLFPIWDSSVDFSEDALSVDHNILADVEGELSWVSDFGDH